VAEASECAGEQDIWEYHDFLFADHGGGARALLQENLKKFAGELELCRNLRRLPDSGKFTKQCKASDIARQIGVRARQPSDQASRCW
jgi:protein-disulfide isomerase